MPLIMGMSMLLACQMLGELAARGLGLAIPGPVIGMVILLVALMIRGKVPSSLRLTGEGLLRYLTLLFVPAGVGLMVHFELIAADLWPIVVTLVASTAMTLGVTAWVLCRWRPVCDASGAVIMFRLSISSAQARKSAELTLLETVAALRRAQGLSEHYLARSRDEQQRLRALLDVIDLGILFVDADRRVRYTNPALERIWSFSDGRDGLLGMRDERLLARAVSQLVAPEAYRRHVAETRGQRGRSAPIRRSGRTS